MKKVLVVNTSYRIFGGEDSSFIDEILFLKKFFEVEILSFNNVDRIDIFDFISFITTVNFKSNHLLKKKIVNFDPDLIYVHNTWFKAGLGIFKILKKSNKSIVLKLHNFRFDCTNTFFLKKHLKNNLVCFKCGIEKTKFQIFNKYYPESFLKSIAVNLYGKRFNKILMNYKNLKVVVLTKYQKKYLLDLGISSKRLHVIENPLNLDIKMPKMDQNKNYFVYAGRIEKNKGLIELLETWKSKNRNFELYIIGSGNFENQIRTLTKSVKNIQVFGQLEHEKVLYYIKNSVGVVTATKMYEGQPRIFNEAAALGVPVIFPNFGGMPEFFPEDYPLVFEQFNYEDFSNKLDLIENKIVTKDLSNVIQNFIFEKLNEEKLKEKFFELLK